MAYINRKKKLKKRPLKRNKFIPREVTYVDYKDVELLEKFINTHGKILAARTTGLSATQQRNMARAIKRARFMALLPYIKERTLR